MKLNNVIVRIRRLFNNRQRYKYKTIKSWSVSSDVIAGSENEVLFDPYVLYENKHIVLLVSNRQKNNIEKIILDSNLHVISKEPFFPTTTFNFKEELINRACVINNNNGNFIWTTIQNKNTSTINCFNLKGNNSDLISSIVPTLNFEKKAVMNPCVLSINGEYKMWYSCGEQYEPDYIGFAKSNNGVTWNKKICPVMSKGTLPFESYKIGACDVHYFKGKYYMFYIGYQNIDVARICFAKSNDGINWIKSDNPLICPEKEKWNRDSCYKPAYFFDKENNRSIIFFNGRKNGIERIGYALYEGNFLEDV